MSWVGLLRRVSTAGRQNNVYLGLAILPPRPLLLLELFRMKVEKIMLYSAIAIWVLALGFMLIPIATASDYYRIPVQGQDGVDGVDGRNGSDADADGAAAVGIAAAQIHPDFDYNGLQGGAAISRFEGQNAIAVGFAQRLCFPNCTKKVLLNGSAVYQDGDAGAGIGANWRF